MNSIGERIKEVRKRFGLTQAQFAEQVAISQTHVSKIEKGVEHPSPTLLRLLSVKYNVDEGWLKDGIGSLDPGWDIRNDEGAIAKYNAMRILFEQKLQSRKGVDLVNTVEAFSFFDALLSPRKLSGEDFSKYLSYVSMAFDEYEKLIFAVSTNNRALIPSKKDAKGWLTFRSECESRLDSVFENVKSSVNLYMALFGEEMKLSI